MCTAKCCAKCAVCILMFTSTLPCVFSNNFGESFETNVGITFDVDGIYGLNSYQAVTRAIDLYKEKANDHAGPARNISQYDLGLLVNKLRNRLISCGHQDDHNGKDTRDSPCNKCLVNETAIFGILALDPSQGINSKAFTQVSSILLNSVLNLDRTCSQDESSYDEILTNLISLNNTKPADDSWSEHEIEEILEEISHFYVPSTNAKCFSARDLEQGADAEDVKKTVESISSLIITNLVLGRCIGEPSVIDKDEFTVSVFEKYGNGGYIIDDKEFDTLLSDLRSNNGDVNTNLTINKCFSSEEILEIYGIDQDIDREAFHDLCPSLIQQIMSGACKEGYQDMSTGRGKVILTKGQVWGYGCIAVFAISLTALAGIAVLPCLHSTIYENFLQMFIAGAVATLSGDAILHLIPQAIGVHNHGGHGSNINHGPLSPELAYIWKCLVAYLTVYMMFLFESGVEMCGGGETHDHMEHNSLKLQSIRNENPKDNPNMKGSAYISSSTQELDKEVGYPVVHSHRSRGCFGKGTLPVMIILGDAIHNFGDGLAIGAAFSSSASAGLSTSIAVFCHELPHELGDFAVLLNSGLSFKMALLLNFLSALSAFLGLAVAVVISSSNDLAKEWIFALAAGMFLYVSLVDMMPELIHHRGEKPVRSRWVLFLLQNIGFLGGATIILVIALYEDSLAPNFI